MGKLFIVKVDGVEGFRIPVKHRWQIQRRTRAALAAHLGRPTRDVVVRIRVGNRTRTAEHSGWG